MPPKGRMEAQTWRRIVRNYRIFIPSKGRMEAQFTWDNIPDELKPFSFIVCPEEEVDGHVQRMRNVIPRPPVKLSEVRQWLIEEYEHVDCIIMLDDDLSFFIRKSEDAPNLRPVTDSECVDMFDELASYICIGEFVHGGISPRQGNNWLFPAKVAYNTRMNAVHAVNPKRLNELGVRYDEVDMLEDYNLTLRLFALGHGNFQLARYAWDQNRGSGAPGGFQGFRTKETQAAAAKRLAELHPDFVKTVEKTPKTGTGDFEGTRLDVRIQWKKAYNAGQKSPKM